MTAKNKSRLPQILKKNEAELLKDWLDEINQTTSRQHGLMKEGELKEQCASFVRLIQEAVADSESVANITSRSWDSVRELLANISRSRSIQGMTPSDTAIFVFSFKKPLFTRIRREIKDVESLAEETWIANELLDKLGLFTMEVYQKTREEVIHRQQQELMELSTPVVKLWNGIVALPLIGTLDSSRTQVVMESLLQRIVETGAEVAIIDITGVPTVDTLVAQHLIKTVTAARLMGAECIISGIRPQIAQTIVHLGVNLGEVTTKASLADAFARALQCTGQSVMRSRRPQKTEPSVVTSEE